MSANWGAASIPSCMASAGQDTDRCSRASFSFSLVLSWMFPLPPYPKGTLYWVPVLQRVLGHRSGSCFCPIAWCYHTACSAQDFLSLLDLSIAITHPSALHFQVQLGNCFTSGIGLMLFVDFGGVEICKWVFLEIHLLLCCSHKTFFAENPSGTCYHVVFNLKYPYD